MSMPERHYLWQGRCSERKYGNTKLIAITLASNHRLDGFINQLALTGQIIETGDAWQTVDDQKMTVYWNEVFVVDSYRDPFFAMLREHSFKPI